MFSTLTYVNLVSLVPKNGAKLKQSLTEIEMLFQILGKTYWKYTGSTLNHLSDQKNDPVLMAKASLMKLSEHHATLLPKLATGAYPVRYW